MRRGGPAGGEGGEPDDKARLRKDKSPSKKKRGGDREVKVLHWYKD